MIRGSFEFIIHTHHAYVLDSIPLLQQYSSRVAEVHGPSDPSLVEVANLIVRLSADLRSHMQKEELVLFPYIKDLVNVKKSTKSNTQPRFGTIKNPVAAMEHEHDEAGNIMKELAQITNQFTPIEYACNTYKALFLKLEEFQNDLFQHIHLENNILFPKAIKLEEELSL